MTRLWIDVEDLFQYATGSPRPSGIQRLAFEIQRALTEMPELGDMLRFVRHDPLRNSLSEVAWDEVVALYHGMISGAPLAQRPPSRQVSPPQRGVLRRSFAGGVNRLPSAIREPLARAVRQQKAAVRELAEAARLQLASVGSLGRAIRVALHPPRHGPHAMLAAADAEAFAAAVRPGDILLALGSPWWHSDYAALVARARACHGLRFALLLYDLIPLRRPEWCDHRLVATFGHWLDSVLPLADTLLAISQATARDVERHAAQRGLALPGPIVPIPIGSGFGVPPGAARPSPALPSPGSYVLFVSTIEARKNHLLLFRAWRRLLEEMPPAELPTLVFAGRVGWLVADLMAQLDNTDWLDGHVVVVENPSDEDLVALYRGCLFTVFPSLYEGWGLPITESFTFGKPCVAANVTSLPEAGGKLARYFDPDDLNDAVRVIRAVLQDRAGLAAWEAQIRREFRPTAWSASAQAVLQALKLQSAPPGAPPMDPAKDREAV